ncbi:LuxR C-terminal-related transcriptional regulator [Rhodobacter sp. Har01]|uniref:LuxR C-terminal-related transcriptional regulator n=1 Tax=Rhodobacter sp. Har01 TaxID=2883999 RepID=UPI001D06C831|nr:LuxR C-terminal-related transcriptional regulator [Rhodobacter sp. Har01]MCB6180152.1 LuxR C-terminal-related transcriptional regulator [Rhodobacter sp. Har01]
MSNGRSQILPFSLVLNGTSQPRGFSAGAAAVWDAQLSAQALFRQNAALRAQNAALKQALDGQANPLPRLISALSDRDLPAEILCLPPTRRTNPVVCAEIRQCLTLRQRQVLALVLAGCPSKNIATDLGISQRTVENHRAAIMRRTGATSVPALARLVIGAAQRGDCKAVMTRHPPRPEAILCRHATLTRKALHAPE